MTKTFGLKMNPAIHVFWIRPSNMRVNLFYSGFTLIELLVVLAIIALLVGLVSPVLARGKSRAQTISCSNNLRQIQLAWLAYVHDNDDRFPPNISRKLGFDQVNVVVEGRVPWVLGNAKLDTNSASLEMGVLFKYSGSTAVFHCPSDRSIVRDSRLLPRIRSYSMSQYFNLDVVSDSALDGVPGSEFNLRKMAQLLNPGPSRSWVFLDEHEISIDDGVFGFQIPRPPNPGGSWIWGSFPGDRHNNSANVSFADGHVETHSWRAHRVISSYAGGIMPIRRDDTANLEDQHWLWDRLPRPH